LIRNVDVALDGPGHTTYSKKHTAAHRRSLEEEVRELLRGAITRQPQEEHIVDLALRLFGPNHGVEMDPTARQRTGTPATRLLAACLRARILSIPRSSPTISVADAHDHRDRARI
jgi:plasmid stability protein